MIDVTRDVITRYMRKSLVSYGNRQGVRFNVLAESVFQGLKKDALVGHPFNVYKDLGPIHPLNLCMIEAFHQLHIKGYVIPNPGIVNMNPYNFVVTPSGEAWASTPDPCPDDTDEYIKFLHTRVPDINSTIDQYIREAVVTFNRDATFASAVMLGAASEACIYLLSEALYVSISDPTIKKKVRDLIDERGKLPSLLTQLSQHIDAAKKNKNMPYSTHQGSDKHLLSLQESIRVQRNDAGHPLAGNVDRIAVRIGLAAFPFACLKVYDLIHWFEKNTV